MRMKLYILEINMLKLNINKKEIKHKNKTKGNKIFSVFLIFDLILDKKDLYFSYQWFGRSKFRLLELVRRKIYP